MRADRAYLLGSGLALAMLACVTGLQVPRVVASPRDAAMDTMRVNRTLKGDRLPAIAPTTDGKPAEPQDAQAPRARPRLPDGCEAAVSAMSRSSLARTPGRCIS
jgi:hypothetical protein